jgi:hypothetical protein
MIAKIGTDRPEFRMAGGRRSELRPGRGRLWKMCDPALLRG